MNKDELGSDKPSIEWLLDHAPISQSLPAGGSVADIAQACARAMAAFAGVAIGEVDLTGVSTSPFLRGVTLHGSAADQLRNAGFVHLLQEGRLHICKKAPEGWPMTAATKKAPPKPPGRRGPTRGDINRYEEADRALFPKLEKLAKSEGSPTAAAKKLAEQGEIKGGGTEGTKTRRLVKLYRKTR